MRHPDIAQISQNLRRNESHSQHPSPTAAFEPPYPRNREGCCKQKEWDSHCFPKRYKFFVSARIKTPNTVRAVPCHTNVTPAREAMTAPKNRKMPTAINPRGDFVIEALAEGGIHPLTITRKFSPPICSINAGAFDTATSSGMDFRSCRVT